MIPDIIKILTSVVIGFSIRIFWEHKSKKSKDRDHLIDINNILQKVIDWTDLTIGNLTTLMDELIRLSYQIQLKANKEIALEIREFAKSNRAFNWINADTFKMREGAEDLKSEIEGKLNVKEK